jgi:hypothetical protein
MNTEASAGIVLESQELIIAGRDLSLIEYPSMEAALEYGIKCENYQILSIDAHSKTENSVVFYDKHGKGYVKYICSKSITENLSKAMERM